MKLSIFNSIIIINNKHTLLYNSFTGKFLVIRKQILELKNLFPDKLKRNNIVLYNQLLEAGMIVESHIDEVALLKLRIDNADYNYNEFILHINPTLDCNFRCWYCYENHILNSKMNNTILNATLTFITSILHKSSIKTFELGFFGGEPLLHFNDIAKKIIIHSRLLCEQLNKELHIHFTSNGSLLNDDIIQFLSQSPCGFQITLDGDKSSHDKIRFNKDNSGSFDTIIKNIYNLINAQINVIVRINYTSKNINTISKIFDYFSNINESQKKFIKFDFQRVWQDKSCCVDETEEKIKEIRHKFKASNFIVLTNYIPHDVRDSCYGDKINHVLINFNGDIFGCTARDFTNKNRIGFIDALGNIHYDTMIIDKRNNSKLSKSVCKTCRIAPICGGGCKQRGLEAFNSKECTFNYTEEEIDNIILEIFEYSLNINPE